MSESEGGAGEKKRGLRIPNIPRVVVETSIGAVFLYEPRDNTIAEYSRRSREDSAANVRWYLARTASKTERKHWQDELIPLPDDDARALSHEDLERLSERYLQTSNSQHFIREAKKARRGVMTRVQDESAIAFLDRLLRFRAKHERDELRRLADPTMLLAERTFGRSMSLLSELDRQAHGLQALAEASRMSQTASELLRPEGATNRLGYDSSMREQLREAEEINRLKIVDDSLTSIQPEPIHFSEPPALAVMRADVERRRRERDEDVEIRKEQREILARSADHLANLTITTTAMLRQFGEFLTQFAESGRRSDRGMKIGIWIAACSMIVSMVLAVASYWQDRSNDQSTDEWQKTIARTLSGEAQASAASIRTLSAENQRLAERVKTLEAAARRGGASGGHRKSSLGGGTVDAHQ